MTRATRSAPSAHPAHSLGKASALPPARAIERAASIFRALGDVPRLRLLALLASAPLCVSEIAELEGEEISTISQRLRVLRAEALVQRKRDGKHLWYSLADAHVRTLVEDALAHALEERTGSEGER